MKVLRALALALTLTAPALHAQDAAGTPAGGAVDPALPTKTVPSPKATTTTDLTPAKDIPLTPPADNVNRPVDLMPAQDLPPNSPASETTLTPEMPAGTTTKPGGSAISQPGTTKEKKNKTEVSADELEARVRFRVVKTRALKDPAVQTYWEESLAAHTDWEKREALKKYYIRLYTNMERMDSSLKTEIATRREVSMRRLTQTRIDPTERPLFAVVEAAPVVKTTKTTTTTVTTPAKKSSKKSKSKKPF